MKRYRDLIAECLKTIQEIQPWDLQKKLESDSPPFLLDVREPYEFEKLHIRGSINVPRGVLEQACEYGFEETVPELIRARDQEVVAICRSGNRSVLAAFTLSQLGYQTVISLRTGVRGWNDYELPLQNSLGQVFTADEAEVILEYHLRPEQQVPKRKG